MENIPADLCNKDEIKARCKMIEHLNLHYKELVMIANKYE